MQIFQRMKQNKAEAIASALDSKFGENSDLYSHIEQLEITHQKKIDELKQDYEEKMKQIKDDYKDQIKNLQNKHKQGMRMALILSLIALVLHL